LPFFASFRVRLILLVLLAVLPALFLIIYTAVEQRRQGMDAAQENALRAVRMAVNNYDHLIDGTRQLLVTLAQIQEVQSQNIEACRSIFTNILTLHPVYANIGAIRRDGQVFASALGPATWTNVADRSFFRKATNRLDFVVGEFEVDPFAHLASVHTSHPVFDKTRALQGVVFADLDLGWLNSLVADANLPKESAVTVIDREGKILMRYPEPEKYIDQALPSQPRPKSKFSQIPLPLPREWTLRSQGMDGIWRLYGISRLGGRLESKPATITVGIPLSAAYAVAQQSLLRNVLLLGAATGMALMAAWYGGDIFFLRRVRALVRATDRLREGDLKVRTGLAHGEGELLQLARGFDEMAEALERRVSERQRAEVELKALNESLERRVTARTSELKRSNEDLEQFAYVASHDLQEPLRMVTNYLQLLRQRYHGKFDTNADEFIAFALDGAERMQALIMGLLSYSRVSTQGKAFEEVDCQRSLERALANLKTILEESAATVLHDRLPKVRGDPVQLTQLFQNLISNALKFHGQEPPRVQIRVQRRGQEWQFAIQDNGIGIAEKDFERIFILFQRLHTRDKYPGTGIGLSFCKKIVERHGGEIWVESQPSKGTTFYFTLPVLTVTRAGQREKQSHNRRDNADHEHPD
jgi:signal transduction histidine kinase